MNDYTLFGVDMKVTPISKYRKEAYDILEKNGYSLQNLRKLKVGGDIPKYLHTLVLGLEYILSRNLYYELPSLSEAFLEEVALLDDRLPSRRSYKKIGIQYRKGARYPNLTVSDVKELRDMGASDKDLREEDERIARYNRLETKQYKAKLYSNMVLARKQLQKIFNLGLKVKNKNKNKKP